jgi:hypothetical protein
MNDNLTEPKLKKVSIHFRVTYGEWLALTNMAKQDGRNISDMLREIVRSHAAQLSYPPIGLIADVLKPADMQLLTRKED